MNGNINSGCCNQCTKKTKREVVNKNRVNNPIDKVNSYYFQTKQNTKSQNTRQNNFPGTKNDSFCNHRDNTGRNGNIMKSKRGETNLHGQDTGNEQYGVFYETADEVHPVNTGKADPRRRNAGTECTEETIKLENYLSSGVAAIIETMDGNMNSGCCSQGTKKTKRKVVNKNLVNNPIDRGNSYYYHTKRNTKSQDTTQMNSSGTKNDSFCNHRDNTGRNGNIMKPKRGKTNLHGQDTGNEQYGVFYETADEVHPVNTGKADPRRRNAGTECTEETKKLENYLSSGVANIKYGQIQFHNPPYPNVMS